MTSKICYVLAFLTGLGLIFIGLRFILDPEHAEAGFGLHFREQGEYAFHYIKGIRDIFTGLILCLLLLLNERKALALTLLAGAIIPFTDWFIVYSKSYNGIAQQIPHIIAIIVALTTGLILLLHKTKQTPSPARDNSGKIIQSADSGDSSIFESDVLPGEKTPWHYHTDFAETFEVIKGRLHVGKNHSMHILNQGDSITIRPFESHRFHNTFQEACILRTILAPGNKNFEHAVMILKGLANDGRCNAAGIPKNLSDLAVFLYLNNSKMNGFLKIAMPLFGYLVNRSKRNGHLDRLIHTYCYTATAQPL
jgi:mannose-6-phosphate isomerase-like protein (cupin superfamily)